MAAVDYCLKLDGIEGESQDAKHKGEIDLESWSWGETQTGTMHAGGGGGAGKVQMQDFHFVMKVNKSSPKLMLACASGEHIKSATLTCRKAGKEQQSSIKSLSATCSCRPSRPVDPDRGTSFRQSKSRSTSPRSNGSINLKSPTEPWTARSSPAGI